MEMQQSKADGKCYTCNRGKLGPSRLHMVLTAPQSTRSQKQSLNLQ